ncbi:MAG: TonB-dependent receptor [Candidatus Zixiibacteriota bacterium]
MEIHALTPTHVRTWRYPWRRIAAAMIALALLWACQLVRAADSTGVIAGTVLDGRSGEPVIGASVLIAGTTIGAATDLDGRFRIRNAPAGAQTVLVSSVGYQSKQISAVEVKAQDVITVDAALTAAATEIAPIVVTAERARASEAAVMVRRRAAANVTDGMSAEMIRKTDDGNAGEALRRVVGVTVVDGRSLVVRGMGGRYSTVRLNGATIPSPEPEKREVPLDMFPSGLIQDMVATKTFTPDQPGDFSGGAVDLETTESPDQLVMKFSSTGSYNTETTGKRALNYADVGTEPLPELMSADWGKTSASIEQAGEALALRQWTPTTRSGMPYNSSLSLEIGNRLALADNVSLGVAGSVTDRTSYRHVNSLLQELSAGQTQLRYDVSQGVKTASRGGLGTATLLLGSHHKLAARVMYTRIADSEARYARGFHADFGPEIIVEETRMRYVSREISTLQLNGEHNLPGFFNSRVQWRGVVSDAGREEPGTLTNEYHTNLELGPDTVRRWEMKGLSGVNVYMDHDDNDAQFSLDWSFPVKANGLQFKVGGLFENKSRNSEARRYRFSNYGGQPPTAGLAEAIFTPDNIGAGRNQYQLTDGTYVLDHYDVNQHVTAGYLMAEWPLWRELQVVCGARHENSDMRLYSADEGSGTGASRLYPLRTGDWLPMAGIVWHATEKLNLRGAVSRTLGRPEYRELAPFVWQDYAQGRATSGNPALKTCYITNYDLRCEYFPGGGDVLAVSVFRKEFDHPIERYVDPSRSKPYVSFTNAASASNYGVEFEARRSLEFLSPRLSTITLGGSLSLIHSNVVVEVGGAHERHAYDRPLTGQSPYAVNLLAGYTAPNGKMNGAIVYNAFGDRLDALDVFTEPPYYERTRHQLDLTLNRSIGWGVGLKASAKNLLGSKYRVTQGRGDKAPVTEEYELGRSYSLGVSYSL